MSRRLDIKYPLDESGNEYMAMTHTDAVIGLDITNINESISINLNEILSIKSIIETMEQEIVLLKNENLDLKNRITVLEENQGGE